MLCINSFSFLFFLISVKSRELTSECVGFRLEAVWIKVIRGESRCFHGWTWKNGSEWKRGRGRRGFFVL